MIGGLIGIIPFYKIRGEADLVSILLASSVEFITLWRIQESSNLFI